MNEEHVLEEINTEGWTSEEISRAYERRSELARQNISIEGGKASEVRTEDEQSDFLREESPTDDDYGGRHYYEPVPQAIEDQAIEEDEGREEADLFSRLLLSQKFLILGVLALIMVAIPLGFYVARMQQDITYANSELKGIDPTLSMVKLVQLTQQHRALTSPALGGDAASSTARVSKLKEITDAMSALDPLINVQLNNPSIAKDWGNAKTHWQALLDQVKSGKITTPESIAAHTNVLNDYFALTDRIADFTGLALDPNADSYYMMRSGLYAMPKLAEALDRTDAIGTELLALKQADSAQRAVITSLLSLAKSNQKEGFEQLQKTLDKNETAKDALQSLVTKTLNRLDKIAKLTESEILGKQSFNYDPKTYNGDIKSTVVGLYLLNTSTLEQLGKLIETRKARLLKDLLIVAGGILALAIISLIIAYFVSLSVTRPVEHLVGVMRQLASGDSTVRANIQSLDEIGVLARQFDTMVDQRETVSAKIQHENETLNNSIINLLEAVAALAQRDLTVKAPVADDITGPVGDALNYLSDETAKVLKRVVQIAGNVASVSQQVKAQSDTVIENAAEENREVERSAVELSAASEVMLDIAKLALSCNEAATKAILNTDKAQVTVLSTVQGITSIRDTIRETEKRIKRLGERSQEIGSVVTIINGIAERTHILALNASMHAASAGEAGKGFAVVANEVQKLAENAREATMQISNLVNNIQVETADTVTTMNDAISQVVQGTTLAQQAGSEMRETRETTAELVQLVQRIADNSKAQAETTQKLKERSMLIQKSSAETFQQLKDQGVQTDRLVGFSGNLVQSVGVFTLPKDREAEAA
ncbi:methyl-accepting chemotaxis protein [Methyloglobulus sp.]|uniref:methyl-accepting chemotaxis protein n=1 Tax=Methyloglobulus sp. TaxID=2518622 RepID=UPI00398958F5